MKIKMRILTHASGALLEGRSPGHDGSGGIRPGGDTTQWQQKSDGTPDSQRRRKIPGGKSRLRRYATMKTKDTNFKGSIRLSGAKLYQSLLALFLGSVIFLVLPRSGLRRPHPTPPSHPTTSSSSSLTSRLTGCSPDLTILCQPSMRLLVTVSGSRIITSPQPCARRRAQRSSPAGHPSFIT